MTAESDKLCARRHDLTHSKLERSLRRVHRGLAKVLKKKLFVKSSSAKDKEVLAVKAALVKVLKHAEA